MTDIESKLAYDAIKASGLLGERQSMYISVFSTAYPQALTANNATRLLAEKFGVGFSRQGIGSRIKELTDMGLIEKVDKTICEHTKMKVNRWRWTGRRKLLPKKIISKPCDHCKGTGIVSKETYYIPQEIEKIFDFGQAV